MKKYLIYTLFLLAAPALMAQERPYKGDIVVTPMRLEQQGDSLHVSLNFILKNVDVKSRNSVNFTPVLVADTHSEGLPSVEIKGCNSYKSYVRAQSLMSRREMAVAGTPYKVCKSRKVSNKVLSYTWMLPFEAWMKDARLDMYQAVRGCGQASMLAVQQLVNAVQLEHIIVVEPYQIQPYVAYVQPVAEAIKHREMAGEAFLDFVVAKTNIDPAYLNNPRELKKITDMMEEVRNDPTVTVKGISVVGYASPEGILKFNQYLSENRAKALVDYLAPRFDYPRHMYGIEFGGENWSGLLTALKDSDMKYKSEIVSILADTTLTEQTRKAQLKRIDDGEPYRYMLKAYYPHLRKAICKIDYQVRKFDVSEAAEVLKTRPQNLSLNEMYLVANTHQSGSSEFVEVFETAVRMFPEDPTANLNAASTALARKDAVAAEKYLSKVGGADRSRPEYRNAQGALAMLQGDYQGARVHLDAAAAKGLEAAKQNLLELEHKQENSTQIEALQK